MNQANKERDQLEVSGELDKAKKVKEISLFLTK